MNHIHFSTATISRLVAKKDLNCIIFSFWWYAEYGYNFYNVMDPDQQIRTASSMFRHVYCVSTIHKSIFLLRMLRIFPIQTIIKN